MDPRDRSLIDRYGIDQTRYFHQLAQDPKLNILDQLKYSEQINRIRSRSKFRAKTPIANTDQNS